MRHTRLRLAALAVVMAVAAACGRASEVVSGDAIGASELASAGSAWTLLTVNAQPLPVETRHDPSGSVWVTKGRLAFSGTTFTQVITLSETNAAGQTTTRDSWTQGTYSMSGNRIRFESSDGSQWVGNYTYNRISYAIAGNNGPVSFVFVRE
jgi:hypothetical protein